MRCVRAVGGALVGLLVVVACGPAQPTDPSPAAPSFASSAPTPSVTPGAPEIAKGGWYEVDRVGDLQGNLTRTLLVGSLAGTLRARVLLGSQVPDERRGGREPFAWTDPQADGVFAGRVLVWGREGDPTAIEAVSLADGSIETLTVAPEATVHVATADATLLRLFFITVDEASNRPTGLWISGLAGGQQTVRLTYRFAAEPITNLFTYRLVAQPDGSRLAIQPANGPVTVIDVERGESVQLEPGGPMIGFADGQLIAFGARSSSGLEPVIAMDPLTGRRRQISDEATSAQVVPGSAGDLVAVMHQDPADPIRFEIEAIRVSSGEARVAYVHESADVSAGLPRREQTFLGAELAPDWVLLSDSFFPFIHASGASPRPLPEASYPMLLNLRTSEALRIGPFAEGPGS
jgi:hypothetical protein